ncbi:MAG: hypothetical protein V3U03_09730 [Myxococcota bacterium]
MICHLRATLAEPSPYWLTRFVVLRALGFVYFVAFLSVAHQLLPLLGYGGGGAGEELAHRLSLHPPAYFSSSSRIEYMSWRASPM